MGVVPGPPGSPAPVGSPGVLTMMMGGPPPVAGVTRSAEEMGQDDEPMSKRQRVEKLPEGHYYPEADWITSHPFPIALTIQLPSHPEKPEWNLDGTTITLADLPLTMLVGMLRDRISAQAKSNVPGGRMKLSIGSKVLTNAQTLASYNLDDGDVVVLAIRDAKKK